MEVTPIHAPPDQWFDDWWEPRRLLAMVTDHTKLVGRDQLFNDPSLKPLLEAWAAAKFATVLSQDRQVTLRLERDRFPDFQLKVCDEFQQFELVEADREGRRRGNEYQEIAEREAQGLPPETEMFDPGEEESEAISALGRAIKRKAAKKSNPCPHLIVYVNFFLFGEPPIPTLLASEMASQWDDSFASAWLLWGSFVIRLWPRPAKIRDRVGEAVDS
jgi:hypothetical protein